MSIATKYINKDEYDRDWEPRYQALELKYYNEEGKEIGDVKEYDGDLDKLDYQYAKTVSERIHQKIADILVDCKNNVDSREYSKFEKSLSQLQEIWTDFNSSFHYKMNGRTILERD